jgi:hypothetical protein
MTTAMRPEAHFNAPSHRLGIPCLWSWSRSLVAAFTAALLLGVLMMVAEDNLDTRAINGSNAILIPTLHGGANLMVQQEPGTCIRSSRPSALVGKDLVT